MSKKKIEPTDAMVADVLAAKYQLDLMNVRAILRAALNHPDAPGLFECDHTDCVHMEEVATRVEAAREQGWDDAADWSIHNINDIDAERIRKANPYRPVQELPEEDGAVIVPADGHEYIETQTGKKSRRLTWDAECLVWYEARGTHLHGDITTGTWKVDDR